MKCSIPRVVVMAMDVGWVEVILGCYSMKVGSHSYGPLAGGSKSAQSMATTTTLNCVCPMSATHP